MLMPYKWVVSAFLHCEILVKISKTREQRENTLRNEERPSVSTKKTECDHKGLLTCTEQFSASNIVAEAASHSTTWCIVSLKFANNFANPFSACMNFLYCILKISWDFLRKKIIFKTKMEYSLGCKIFQLASKSHAACTSPSKCQGLV